MRGAVCLDMPERLSSCKQNRPAPTKREEKEPAKVETKADADRLAKQKAKKAGKAAGKIKAAVRDFLIKVNPGP